MSAYSEKEILSRAIQVIEEYGELSITELKAILKERMSPSGDDLEILQGRNDTKFDQKVRNLVSHRQNNDLDLYFEYRKVGNTGTLKAKGNAATRKLNRKKFNARKIDFDVKNENIKELGLQGEVFVLNHERQRVPSEWQGKVRHISQEDGDGAGYDILSCNDSGEAIFIEVKTTTGPYETPVYLTENEKAFLETYADNAVVARVYNFNKVTQTGELALISASDFLKNSTLRPILYRCTL